MATTNNNLPILQITPENRKLVALTLAANYPAAIFNDYARLFESAQGLRLTSDGTPEVTNIRNNGSDLVVTNYEEFFTPQALANIDNLKIYTLNYYKWLEDNSVVILHIPQLQHPDMVLIQNIHFKYEQEYDVDQIRVMAPNSNNSLSIPTKYLTELSYSSVLTAPEWLMFEDIYNGRGISYYSIFTPINAIYRTRQYDPYSRINVAYSQLSERIKYNENLVPDEEGNYKHLVPNQTKSFMKDYLREQIRTRYGFFERPSSGLSNVVLDSFFPRLMYNYEMSTHRIALNESFPRTACAISPLVAECLNVKRIQTEQLCRVLGYDTKAIKALIDTVRAKKINIVFAGAGGTGMNTSYWLTELCTMVHAIDLFDRVCVFEPEIIEYSNMFRFPISLAAYTDAIGKSDSPYKMLLIEPMAQKLSAKKPVFFHTFLNKGKIGYRDIDNFFTRNWDRDTGKYTYTTKPNTIIYGAPSLSARAEMTEFGNFIAATHANTSCSLWLNPKQEQDIQVESYGMIQLGAFFMNQLRMAIGLLEVLATRTNFSEQDQNLLTYEFTGDIQLRTDRQYNWQITRDINMMTEEAAATLN